MQSLFKTVPEHAFSPHIQPLLRLLKKACEQAIAKGGLDSGQVDCFVAAAARDGLLEAVFGGDHSKDLAPLLEAGNLEFLAAYAMETDEFDAFWVFISELNDDFNLFCLEDQLVNCGLTSVVRRIGFADERLRRQALACLINRVTSFCGQSGGYQTWFNEPWHAMQTHLALESATGFAEAQKNLSSAKAPQEPAKSSIWREWWLSMTSPHHAPTSDEIDQCLKQMAEPEDQLTGDCLERLIGLVVYNPMVSLEMQGLGCSAISERVKPWATQLLANYGFSRSDSETVFRQMLVNGLSAYPHLRAELDPTKEELLGTLQTLSNISTGVPLCRTLSGPYGAFILHGYHWDDGILQREMGNLSLTTLFDSQLTRTPVVRGLPLYSKLGDKLVLQMLIQQKRLFPEAVAQRWGDIEVESHGYTDEAIIMLLDYHVDSALHHSEELGMHAQGGRRLLQRYPHLMADAVEILAARSTQGVDPTSVSQLAKSMGVNSSLLLNHHLLISNQTLQADVLGNDLGL